MNALLHWFADSRKKHYLQKFKKYFVLYVWLLVNYNKGKKTWIMCWNMWKDADKDIYCISKRASDLLKYSLNESIIKCSSPAGSVCSRHRGSHQPLRSPDYCLPRPRIHVHPRRPHQRDPGRAHRWERRSEKMNNECVDELYFLFHSSSFLIRS